MRDLLVVLIVTGSLPFILARPWLGILMWTWLGYMNPHRLTWSYAYDIPFAQIVGITTLVAFVFAKDKRGIPLNSTTALWIAFVLWFCFTTLFALNPTGGIPDLEKALKIQLFSFLTLMLIRDKQRLHALLWVIVLSLGFYGAKGGLWVLRTGGTSRVWGPSGSFLSENNALALALIMAMPLMWYLYRTLEQRWQRMLMGLLMGLTGFSILGSHSRGAALAGACMLLFLVAKSRKRAGLFVAILLLLPLGVVFMPTQWTERMETIQTYEQDSSAMGRLTAWQFAIELANQRPLVGGGFDTFVEEQYRRFSPALSQRIDERDGRFQGSHSIYFRVLGEHGYVGLALFLLLGLSAYRRASAIARRYGSEPESQWAADLASMIQVSLVGYAVAGAFLGLSYFDLYYQMVGLVIIAGAVVSESQPRHDALPAPLATNTRVDVAEIHKQRRPTTKEPA